MFYNYLKKRFKLFSKKITIDEFQQSYEKSDSKKDLNELNHHDHHSISHLHHQANNLTSTTNDANILSDNIVIDKKISHQLGAQISCQPNGVIVIEQKAKSSSGKTKKILEKTHSNPTETNLNNSNNLYQSHISNNSNERNSLIKKYSEESKNTSNNNVNNFDNLENLKEVSKIMNKNDINNKRTTVFGLPLASIMQHTGQPLPQRIIEAMKFIRKIAPNEIGIFRKNGNKSRINKLKEYININEKICFNSDELTVFDIADTIKLYFRELPECLITNKLSDILLPNYSSKFLFIKNLYSNKIIYELFFFNIEIRPEERKLVLQQVMLLIPDENRLVLQTLLLFLSEIAKYHKTNQVI
jgi:hypothetical protein